MRLYGTLLLVLMTLIIASCTPANFDRAIGAAYVEATDYDAAIVELKKAASKEPRDSNNHFWLGKAYYEKGQYENAIVHLTKAIELQQNNYSYHVFLALSYYEIQQYQKAINAYHQAILINPLDAASFNQIAFCNIRLQQYDKAVVAAKAAIALDPYSLNNYNLLGYAYGMKKQYEEAFNAFKKSIELHPQHADSYYNFGQFLILNNAYVEAVEYLKKAISLQSNNRTYLFVLADAYYKQGTYDDALDAINKSINLDIIIGIGAEIGIVNDYPEIKGIVESGSAAKKAGLLIGDRITKINGEKTINNTIEKIVQGLRGKEGTRVVLTIEREALSKPFEKTVTRERIITAGASTGIGYRSLILRQMGKHEEALKEAKQAYSLDSSDALAQLALGASNLDHGQYAEAVKSLSQVASIDARVLEATAYAKQGNFKKAVEMYSAIPEENLLPKNVPLWSNRTALLDTLKPFIAAKIESAGRLKSQGHYKEALNEFGDALQVANDKTSEDICGSICRIMNMDPRLSELPEEARKYALRGDMLTEQGTFEEAAKEYRKAVQAAPYIAYLYFNAAMNYGDLKRYPQAIRSMNTYLQLAPEAPNARAAQDQVYKWEYRIEKGAR